MNRFILMLAMSIASCNALAADANAEMILEASAKIAVGNNAVAIIESYGMECSTSLCSSSVSRTTWVGPTQEISIGLKGDIVEAVITSYKSGDFDGLLRVLNNTFGQATVKSNQIMTMNRKEYSWRKGAQEYALTKYSGTAIDGCRLEKAFSFLVIPAE